MNIKWRVEFTGKALKQKEKLPIKVQEVLYQLVREMEIMGHVRGGWPNYSKLSDFKHHCHLKKGKPTYVAVWREIKEKIQFIEVIYAGSHEKHHIDEEMVTIRLRVHRSNAPKIKEYAKAVELDDNKQTYTIDEVFPEYIGKESQAAIRAYRCRENLTQKQLAQLTGIPQRHLSEMENGKRVISKEIAETLAKTLNTDYQMFL